MTNEAEEYERISEDGATGVIGYKGEKKEGFIVFNADYDKGIYSAKCYTTHYNEDGTFKNMTIENIGRVLNEERDFDLMPGLWARNKIYDNPKDDYYSKITTKKRLDVKDVLLDGVPGHEWLEANKPEYFDKNGKALWGKEAEKRRTANALKVQKEQSKLKAKGLGKTAESGNMPWVDDAKKKMATKTEQKPKTTKTKTTAKVLPNAKANGGRE